MGDGLLRAISRFNPLYWRPWSATRCTIGVGIPLIWGVATGHPAAGVLGALGALYAGFNSFRGPYVSRLRMMAATTAIMSGVTLLGGLICGSHWLATVVIAIIAFVLALFSSTGTAGLLFSIQGTAVLIVLASLPVSAANPLGNALVVLGGGALQMIVMTAVWPFDPRYPERRAVERAYRSLANFAHDICSGGTAAIPDSEAIQEARSALSRLRQQPPELVYAVRVSETIRAALVGLARAGDCPDAVADVERALRAIAQEIRLGVPVATSLRISGQGSNETRHWAEVIANAIERLHHPPAAVHAFLPEPLGISARTLFTSSTFGKLALQHAARYAFGVAFAFAVAGFWKTPHAYWLPLSTCILLRADYATTLNRGLTRTAGTLGGILVATAVARLDPSAPALTALILVATWIGCAVYLANYALFTMAITCYAVFSVAATAVAERAAAMERLEATVAGAAFAISLNYLWPIWQSRKVAQVLRDAIDAQIEYGKRVEALFGHDAMPWEEIESADQARHRARALRIQAERVVQAAALEPPWSRRHLPSRAEQLIGTIDENAADLLSLHAQALQDPTRRDLVLNVARALETAKGILAEVSDPVLKGDPADPAVRSPSRSSR